LNGSINESMYPVGKCM